jgi:AcrR family transcriptional regulator
MNPGSEPVKSVDGRQVRWVEHREQRRAALVDAAIKAIKVYGSDVGMDAIAAEAGISKPVLYRYFADKSALWLAVGQRIAATVVAVVEPAVAQLREEREVIAAVIDTYLGAVSAEPELYRFLRQTTDVREATDAVAGALARVIGDRLRALGLDAGPAEPWAVGLVGCVHAVGDWWLRHHQPIGREALCEYLTTLVWGGISGVVVP